MLLIERVRAPHDDETLRHNAIHVCEPRGFHGPFANHAIYQEFPGWEHLADCMTCGSTVADPESTAAPRKVA